MKTKRHLILLLVLSVFLLFGTACKVHYPQYHKRGMIISSPAQGKVPPGQMKKATGAKSAKAYAPGQVKKKRR